MCLYSNEWVLMWLFYSLTSLFLATQFKIFMCLRNKSHLNTLKLSVKDSFVYTDVRLSYIRPSISSFSDGIVSKYQCMFTKLSMWIDIVEDLGFFFFFFFFFDLGFTALSRIFLLYRADRSSKVGENRRTRRKTTWPSASRTWLSHIWPEPGSNHSGENPI